MTAVLTDEELAADLTERAYDVGYRIGREAAEALPVRPDDDPLPEWLERRIAPVVMDEQRRLVGIALRAGLPVEALHPIAETVALAVYDGLAHHEEPEPYGCPGGSVLRH